MILENMLKKIKIEFYLTDSFEIFHFLPFYEYFRNQGFDVRFVAEPCDRNISGNWFDYDSACQILKSQGVLYSKKANKHADFAFTTQDAYLLGKYTKKTKRINLSYGFSFINNYFIHSERTTKGFDFRFVHGVAQKKMLSKYMDPSKIYIVGYQKYKNVRFTREKLFKELNIKTSKKILCYFPTWDEDATIAKFHDEFKKLSADYYIITKPHHCTARLDEKKEDLEYIRSFSNLVLDGIYDFAKAAVLGDVAICDAKSGSTMEVPYLNPDIKLIILFNQKFSDDKYDSEILKVGSCVFDPEMLGNAIKDILNKDVYAEERLTKMVMLYGDRQKDYLKDVAELIKRESIWKWGWLK